MELCSAGSSQKSGGYLLFGFGGPGGGGGSRAGSERAGCGTGSV